MLQLVLQLQSGINQRIKAAQASLAILQHSNVFQFFSESMIIMTDEAATPDTRQLVSTLLRQTILRNINGKPGWDNLTKENKQQVKDALASLLQNKNRKVRRAAADNVSAICSLEVPRGEWPHIIPNLIVGVTSQDNMDIKEAALMALGFISQIIKQKGSFLDKETNTSIFEAIVTGVKDTNPSINQLAMTAFISFLHLCQSLFESDNVRNVVLKQLINVVETSPDMESKKMALQCLAEVVKEAYFAMEPCVDPLINFTNVIMQNHTYPDLCKRSMEVWRSFFEQANETETRNYINQSQSKILATTFLSNMAVVTEDQDDENEESIRGAAYRALCALGECNATSIRTLVLNFVAQTIADPDWKKRQASVKAFTCLLDGAQLEQIYQDASRALEEFLKLLNDSSTNVQASAAYSLAKIAEKLPYIFIKHTHFKEILTLLATNLNKKVQIAKDICSIFSFIFGKVLNEDSKILFQVCDNLMDALFQTGMRTDVIDGSLSGIAFLAAMLLIIHSKNLSVANKYIALIIQNFNQTYGRFEGNVRPSIHAGILSVLQGSIHVAATQQDQPLHASILDSVYGLISTYFNRLSDVDANGLYILAQLSAVADRSSGFFQSAWVYVMHAMKKPQDPQLFRATLILIGDLSRHSPQKFKASISIILQLSNFLANPQFDNDCKISIITFLSDVFLSCPIQIKHYQQKVLSLLSECMNGCLSILNINFQYGDRLRQALIDSASAIMHSICTKNNLSQNFFRILPNLIAFIKINNKKQAKPSIRLMRDSIFLCLDIIQMYEERVKELFKDKFLLETLQVMEQHNQKREHDDLFEFAKMVLRVP